MNALNKSNNRSNNTPAQASNHKRKRSDVALMSITPRKESNNEPLKRVKPTIDLTVVLQKVQNILACINIESQMISLNDKGIDDDCLSLIVQELYVKNNQIRILSLNNNLIGDRGAQVLSEFIPKFKCLEILYLNGNHLSNLSVEKLIISIQQINHSIKVINLEKNNVNKQQLESIGIDLSKGQFKI
ncbi:UNKNOWN [Stylonychia lemnae]|uniref:Uncharacterized protein n=1 Tax=Stylonychia lemnae TaxID=5949 RepID=A0A078AY54_STYLE|nr:UNKNOWN [Stylonychia lemnae]|eukprot:CDW87099.1 UNKNOWN [Stylonychia lemnae]